MSREAHVRFWEGVGVRFPRATQLSESVRHGLRGSRLDRLLLRFYNTRRPHSSLDRQTPDQAYFNWLPQIAAA
jgi:transposase InsO family protein